MPGLIVKVEVEIGQDVKKGDGLIIIEAMKMENELKAAYSGKIKAINVQTGQPVEKNQILIEFE
jgi:biotin carboxyl carrier protein